MFRQFLGISHYFALLKKYSLFLHQTWQMSRRPIANYIYVKNVSKCQSCDVTFCATFEVSNMHIFYNVFERAHQAELKPENILSISQKLNEIWHFQIWKITLQNMGSPLEKNLQIGAVIFFQQMQLYCTCDVPDD